MNGLARCEVVGSSVGSRRCRRSMSQWSFLSPVQVSVRPRGIPGALVEFCWLVGVERRQTCRDALRPLGCGNAGGARVAIRRGSSRFVHAWRGTGRDSSEGKPSAAEVPDGRLKRRPRVFGRPVEDAWRRSKLKSASSRARVGGARGRVSLEKSLRSSSPRE